MFAGLVLEVMVTPANLVFLFDCDNTLLDNDRIHDDLDAHLRSSLGEEAAKSYWRIFEELRTELSYADYLGAVQRLRLERHQDQRVLELSGFLLDYPFADRLYPNALAAVKHCRGSGLTVILSDGDAVFQPRKLERSGILEAVEGRALIYVHKERMLEEMMRRYPARRYVMVDDKLRLLTAMKATMQDKLFTVFPRQGHYAFDTEALKTLPPADLTIDHVGELMSQDFRAL